jgi:hypothetical protein
MQHARVVDACDESQEDVRKRMSRVQRRQRDAHDMREPRRRLASRAVDVETFSGDASVRETRPSEPVLHPSEFARAFRDARRTSLAGGGGTRDEEAERPDGAAMRVAAATRYEHRAFAAPADLREVFAKLSRWPLIRRRVSDLDENRFEREGARF